MPDVTITLKTIDQSTQVTKKVKEEFKSLAPALEGASKGVASFVSANATLIAGLAVVGTASIKAYQSFQKYAGSVRDLALITGTGAKETSKFLQVIDDYQLSAEDATAATKALKEKGLVPTIDTLATLADRYQAIHDPAEKMRFIQENLGRGGAKWVNVLNQSSDALRKQAEEVNKNLILTDEQIKKAELARLAVDEWADAWEGFKVSVGGAVGGLIVLNKQMEDYQEMSGQAAQKNGLLTDQFKAFQAQMKQGAAATEYWTARMEKAEEQTEENTEALKELSNANAKIINDAIDIQQSNDDYIASQDEIKSKIDELKAEKEKLYPWEKDKIADINEAIREQEQAYADGAKAFAAAQTEKLAMMALEKIALLDGVAGFSDAEFAKAQALLDTAGIAEESALREALAFEYAAEQIANAIDPAMQLEDVLRTMSHGYKINVAVNYTSSGNPPQNQAYAPAEFTDTVGPTPAGTSSNEQFGNQKWMGGMIGSFARGGRAGGWGMVGDRQGGGFIPGVSELIYGNARVFNSRQSEKMLRSGMFGKVKGFAAGGMMSATTTNRTRVPHPSDLGSGSSGGSSLSTISDSPVEAQIVAEQVAAQVNLSVQASISNMAVTIAQTMDDGFAMLAGVMKYDNPQAVGRETAVALTKVPQFN